MATDSAKYSSGWLLGTLLIGAACGATIYYFASPKDPCPKCPDPPKLTWLSCFDGKTVEATLSGADAWGARFYLAKQEAGGFAVLVSPIREDGQHSADDSGTVQFRLFKAIRGDESDMTLLSESEAERAVKEAGPAGREPWSLDVKADVLRGLLAVSDANGIGFIDRSTTDGGATFELAPVKVAADAATMVGVASDILIGVAPCPMHCPKDAAYYLHMR